MVAKNRWVGLMLLMLLFTGIVPAELWHNHSEDHHERSTDHHDESEEESCSICDYTFSVFSSEADFMAAPSFTFVSTTFASTLAVESLLDLPSPPVRGPPAIG